MFAAGLVLHLVMVAVPFIFAKAPPDKVTIDGPRLRRGGSVAITDPKMLEDFNPWIAPFLGRPLDEEPSHDGKRYDVSMYLQDEAGAFRLIYILDYYPTATDTAGYIYLPRRGERGYEVNVNIGTISRREGWYHIDTLSSWDEVMDRVLAQNSKPPALQGWQCTAERFTTCAWSVVLVFAAGLGAVGFWSLRRQRQSTI